MKVIRIKGGRIVDPCSGRDEVDDLWIVDGKVFLSAPGGSKAKEEVIDASGKVVAPGLVDIHVHFRDPGQTHKETIRTGSEAAAAGGFTTVVGMPNTVPVCDNAGTFRYIQNAIQADAKIRVLQTGALTRGLEGEQMAPIGSLKNAGVVAVTDDGYCVQNNQLMRQIASYARMFDLPILDHCQDYSLTEGAVINEGHWSLRLGLRGWPREAEEIIVSRNIILSELTGAHIHMQHISSGNSVRMLREAKLRNIRATAEASPHHISLTDSECRNYNTLFKMNPPLREDADRKKIIEGLRDGTIDCIATDHAPHTADEKNVEFDYAPFGIIGLETALPVVLDTLVKEEGFSLLSALGLMSAKAAKVLGIPGGSLSEGSDADIVIFDPEEEWVPGPDSFRSRSHNSPWLGRKLTGKVTRTIVAGKTVYSPNVAPNIRERSETPPSPA